MQTVPRAWLNSSVLTIQFYALKYSDKNNYCEKHNTSKKKREISVDRVAESPTYLYTDPVIESLLRTAEVEQEKN
jgi:hypothetical protein